MTLSTNESTKEIHVLAAGVGRQSSAFSVAMSAASVIGFHLNFKLTFRSESIVTGYDIFMTAE